MSWRCCPDCKHMVNGLYHSQHKTGCPALKGSLITWSDKSEPR